MDGMGQKTTTTGKRGSSLSSFLGLSVACFNIHKACGERHVIHWRRRRFPLTTKNIFIGLHIIHSTLRLRVIVIVCFCWNHLAHVTVCPLYQPGTDFMIISWEGLPSLGTKVGPIKV